MRILHLLNPQNDPEEATSDMAPIVCSYITNALTSLALLLLTCSAFDQTGNGKLKHLYCKRVKKDVLIHRVMTIVPK